MQKIGKQTLLILALAVLTAAFSIGFFAGRNSIPYAVSMQTERPLKKEEPAQSAAEEASQETDARETTQDDAEMVVSYPIDLNTATLEELMTLPRIGQTLAQRILDYRAQYGRFAAAEQLMDVDGIGKGTFEGLKELVTVEDSK